MVNLYCDPALWREKQVNLPAGRQVVNRTRKKYKTICKN
jgi:hypothetical protein